MATTRERLRALGIAALSCAIAVGTFASVGRADVGTGELALLRSGESPVADPSSSEQPRATVVADPSTRPERARSADRASRAERSASTTTTPPSPSTTTTTTTTTLPVFDPADQAPGWEQRRGEAALARINDVWKQVGYEVGFLPGRPGHLGMTYPQERRIEIFVRSDVGIDLLTHVVAHELGHAVDMTWNDDVRRARYLELRGVGARNWFTCNGCTDFATPAGDFAETFAYWAIGGTDFRSTVAPVPTVAQFEQLAQFFRPPS